MKRIKEHARKGHALFGYSGSFHLGRKTILGCKVIHYRAIAFYCTLHDAGAWLRVLPRESIPNLLRSPGMFLIPWIAA